MNVKSPSTWLKPTKWLGIGVFLFVAILCLIILIHNSKSTPDVQVQDESTQQQPSAAIPQSQQSMVQRVDFKLPWAADTPAPAKPSAPTQTTMTKPITTAPATATTPPVVVAPAPVEQPDNTALIQQDNGECVYAADTPKLDDKLLTFFKEKKCKVVHFFQHRSAPAATTTSAATPAAAAL